MGCDVNTLKRWCPPMIEHEVEEVPDYILVVQVIKPLTWLSQLIGAVGSRLRSSLELMRTQGTTFLLCPFQSPAIFLSFLLYVGSVCLSLPLWTPCFSVVHTKPTLFAKGLGCENSLWGNSTGMLLKCCERACVWVSVPHLLALSDSSKKSPPSTQA